MNRLPLAVIALAPLALAGCDKPQEARAQAAPPPPASVAPSPPPTTPPPPPVPTGNLHGFAPDQVLAVRFTGISEKGYPMVMCRNLTGRDIDDISGGFRLLDADGTVLHATGLTLAIPNDLLVAAGEEFESSPFGLNRKQDLMDRLATTPEELSFAFEARDVTFMD